MSAPGRGRNLSFVGVPGTGKTYAGAALATSRSRMIWIDPAGTTRLVRPGSPDHVFRVRTLAEIRAIMRDYATFHIQVGAEHLSRAELVELVDQVLILAMEYPDPVTVVVDEFRLVLPGGRPTETMDRALRAGRHRGVSVWPITQRASDLKPDIRICMEEVWFFRCIDVADHRYMREINKELADRVRQLPNRHALVLDTSTGTFKPGKVL